MAATLNARRRSERGKGAARSLRRAGRVPAVMYGHGDQTEALSVDNLELEKLLASINVENTLIEVRVDDDAPRRALIREVQYHPARPLLLHIDFYQVHAGEKIHLEVPVRLLGSPIGVRENGGILQEVVRELAIECLPRDIPEVVEIDVTSMEIGDSLHVSDVSLPNVRILIDPEVVICTVTGPTVEALPEEPETELGVGGEVEPELIRSRREDADDVPFEHGSEQPE